MRDGKNEDPNLGLENPPPPSAARSRELIFQSIGPAKLSAAQAEFNKLMKRLEKARAEQAREQRRLDGILHRCVHEFFPLAEKIHRANFALAVFVRGALAKFKLTKRRRLLLADLLGAKTAELRQDPLGLSAEDIAVLEQIAAEIGPSESEKNARNMAAAEFDILREHFEDMASEAGVDLDLSDLDVNGDPEEFARKLYERMHEASEGVRNAGTARKPRGRKPTKAQLAREQKEKDLAEARARDLKSLYKQLAKALHPDLEPDPALRHHKEEWMKRLTTAHAAGDLRELLRIELEWLGEEASNLSRASDEKLGVYAMILKEQISEVKSRTAGLIDTAKYFPVRRFCSGFFGERRHPDRVLDELTDKLEVLTAMHWEVMISDSHAQAAVARWADEHGRMLKEQAVPF
jgi:hypothetical protein